jgi:hypothetical protein
MESNGLGCLIHEDQGADLAHPVLGLDGRSAHWGWLDFPIPRSGSHPPTHPLGALD